MYIEKLIIELHEYLQTVPESAGYFTAAKSVKLALQEYERTGRKIMMYYFIGARRMGKTDFFLLLAIELWKRYGKQTMWLRNKLTETDDKKFYQDFLNDPLHFGWVDDAWHTDNSGVWDGEDLVIKFQSLSTYSNRRGPGHPDVDMIFLDEFIPEDRKYPSKNPVNALLSLSMSVFAGREDARIFCASNPVSLANPYFATLEIYPSRQDVTLFPEKGCLIERCKGYRKSITKESSWNAVYRAGKYSGYADEREDRMVELVCKAPKNTSPLPYCLMIGSRFYRPTATNRYVYWQQVQSPAGKVEIYTPDITSVDSRVQLLPNILKKNLEECVLNNTIRFDSPNTLYSVLSILYTV